jgi:hypothetical protein
MSPVVVSPALNDSLEAFSPPDFGFAEGIVLQAFCRRSSAAGMKICSPASPICLGTWTGGSRKALKAGSWSPIQNLIDSVPEMDGSWCRSTRASWCRPAAAPGVARSVAHGPPRNRARSTIARVTLPSASRSPPADSASTANSTLCPSCRTRRARTMTTSPIRLGAR